jgi:hypothetical protein
MDVVLNKSTFSWDKDRIAGDEILSVELNESNLLKGMEKSEAHAGVVN